MCSIHLKQPRRVAGHQRARSAAPPVTGSEREHSLPVAGPSSWNPAQASWLHQRFLHIEREVQRGKPLVRLLRNLSRRHTGKPVPGHPSRKLKLSYPSVVRAWYRWRQGGSNAEALLHRYVAHQKLDPETVREFIAFAASQRFFSLAGAWRKFDADAQTGITYSTARLYVMTAEFEALQALIKARNDFDRAARSRIDRFTKRLTTRAERRAR